MSTYKPLYDPENTLDRDIGLTVAEINGRSAERTNAEGVRAMISEEVARGGETITITVRGSGVVGKLLSGGGIKEGENVVTDVQPRGGEGRGELEVKILKEGRGTNNAGDGDVVEIEYNGENSRKPLPFPFALRAWKEISRNLALFTDHLPPAPPKHTHKLSTSAYYLPMGVLDASPDGGRVLFDSSTSRNSEVSTVQFVLNKQPFGQFPPAFNLACVGIRPGEVRRIVLPKALGLEEEGRKKAKVPKDVEGYVYEIKAVLINAMT